MLFRSKVLAAFNADDRLAVMNMEEAPAPKRPRTIRRRKGDK